MVHRESSHTCWKERNCGRRSSLQGVCAKGVDSRMEELLSHQTQEAGRFANRTGVLLAEIEVGSGKTDSRCFELLSVFPYMERRSAISICVVLSILSGVLGGAPKQDGILYGKIRILQRTGIASPDTGKLYGDR